MYDQRKTKEELIHEIQQLKQENDSFRALTESSTERGNNLGSSSLENRLAMMLQSNNEKLAWWEIEIPTGKIFFDQRKLEVLGYPPEQFKYFSEFVTLIHPDDYQRVMDVINGYLEGVMNKLEVEYRVQAHSGKYVWLFKSGSIVKYDDNGKPLICAGFVYNITERKQVEEELFKSKQMLQTLMDNFPGIIFWKDTQSRYLGCNLDFSVRAGLKSPAQIVGKIDSELPWGDKYAKNFRAEDQEIFKSGQPSMHIDELHFPADGPLSWFDKSKFPLRNSQGQIVGLIGIANDVSRLKLAEQQLIDANNELKLQNEQKAKQAEELNLALQKAEESDRLKSEFLANMSHEIRTPMNSVLGFAELLKDQNITPQNQRKFLQIIEKSIERMLNIINDIVDFSKIESGQMEIYLSKTNVNQEIERISDLYYPEAKYKGLQIFIQTPLSSNEVTIQTDRDKFYAILSNLVKNSVKFTREGSIEIGYEKKDDHLEFYVKDTGIGIPDEQKLIIFKRFRQGSESENKKYEGAGLGLSISKAYVELLGGNIWVESNPETFPENGSAFYFTLPLEVDHEKLKSSRMLTGSR